MVLDSHAIESLKLQYSSSMLLFAHFLLVYILGLFLCQSLQGAIGLQKKTPKITSLLDPQKKKTNKNSVPCYSPEWQCGGAN